MVDLTERSWIIHGCLKITITNELLLVNVENWIIFFYILSLPIEKQIGKTWSNIGADLIYPVLTLFNKTA